MLAWFARALALLSLCATLLLPAAAHAAPASDFAVAGGRFYTEANGSAGAGGSGYAVTDGGGVPFWTAFQAAGGVATFGYPASRRFSANGFTEQVFQKAVMQWNGGSVAYLNVLDVLHAAGKDGWLQSQWLTPPPAPTTADTNLDWAQVVARHEAYLDANAALRAAYFAAPDPIALYGLPVSPVTDEGPALVVRCQRAVLQQWKTAQPWAAAGAVTVANAGDILKSSGLLPGAALTPVVPPGAAAPYTYVALGASDAVGMGASSPAKGYVALLADQVRGRYPGEHSVNLGIDGATTAQVIADEASKLPTLHPSLISITVGPNDILHLESPGQFQGDLDRLLIAAQASGAQTILLANVPDLALSPDVPDFLKPLAHDQVVAFNNAVAAEAAAHGAVLVDLYTLSEQLAPTHPDLISADGFHPSDAGYQIYADAFWQALQRAQL